MIEGLLLAVVLLVDPEGLGGVRGTAAWRGCAPAARAKDRTADGAARAGADGVPRGAEADGAMVSRGRVRRGVAGVASAAGAVHAGVPLLDAGRSGRSTAGSPCLTMSSSPFWTAGLFGLCGPNGAGRAALLNVIGGGVPEPSRGQVLLDGEDITRRPPHQRFYRDGTTAPSRRSTWSRAAPCSTTWRSRAWPPTPRHRRECRARPARPEGGEKAAPTLADLGVQPVKEPGGLQPDAGEPSG